MLPTWLPESASNTDLLTNTDLLIADRATVGYALLREQYHVNMVTTAGAALKTLRQTTPSLVISDLEFEDGSAIEICRRAKALVVPATVLVTTEKVQLVPEAIAAGCDGVLLKPFQPNLLYARIGRLLRSRAAALRLRARRNHAKSEHLRDRSDLLISGTNRHWPATYCPYCAHQGATSFEHASHRKAWYACLECKKVWMAKRQE